MLRESNLIMKGPAAKMMCIVDKNGKSGTKNCMQVYEGIARGIHRVKSNI